MKNSSSSSNDDTPGESPFLRVATWYISFFKGDTLRIAGGVLLTFLYSFALIPIPLILKRIIDSDLPQKDISGLLISGSAGFGLYFLAALLSTGGRALTLLSTKGVTEKLRSRLSEHLQQMSLSFYDKEKASELHAKVVLDTERIDVMSNAVILFGITSIMLFSLANIILFHINTKLLIVCYFMLPIYLIVQRLFQPALKKSNKNFRDQMEGMSSDMNDLIYNIRLVKQFGREDYEQKRAENRFRDVTKSALSMTITGAMYTNTMDFITNTTNIVIYVSGGILAIRSGMTVGEIIAFIGMLGFLINPLNTFMQMINIIYSGMASLHPVYNILALNESLEINHNKKEINTLKGAVDFQDVSFIYDSNDRIAIDRLSFSITPGETIAIVGESGSGKTTLVNMILGFYLPSKGEVLIDGTDIKDINLKTLRQKIGVVSQDNVLLNTSIRENLTYGRLDATDMDIFNAALKAHALDFINKLPDKFDSIAGDRGVRLSGGQKQRLAIARGLVKNAQILIFDEATSALDSESEAKIQEAIEELKINRTCFIIAHRLSTVVNADRIMVLKNGKLIEFGNHHTLLQQDGEYARLCKRQFKPLETSNRD